MSIRSIGESVISSLGVLFDPHSWEEGMPSLEPRNYGSLGDVENPFRQLPSLEPEYHGSLERAGAPWSNYIRLRGGELSRRPLSDFRFRIVPGTRSRNIEIKQRKYLARTKDSIHAVPLRVVFDLSGRKTDSCHKSLVKTK